MFEFYTRCAFVEKGKSLEKFIYDFFKKKQKHECHLADNLINTRKLPAIQSLRRSRTTKPPPETSTHAFRLHFHKI